MRPNIEKRCSFCSAVVGKGRTHKCTKKNMQDNLHKIVKNKSLKSKEKIGSKIIKTLFDDKGGNRRGGTVILSTGGKPLPVSLSCKVNKARFTHEDLKRLQVVHGTSDRGILKTAQAIRHVLGRKSVQSGFAESLIERNRILKPHFVIKEFDMKRKPKDNEKAGVVVDEEGYINFKVKGVVTPDFDELVREITELRELNPFETEILVGLDDGQKFNKIGFSVKNKTEQLAGVNVMFLS